MRGCGQCLARVYASSRGSVSSPLPPSPPDTGRCLDDASLPLVPFQRPSRNEMAH